MKIISYAVICLALFARSAKGQTLAGQIVAPDGKPVAKAHVHLEYFTFVPLGRDPTSVPDAAVTDDDGRFTVEADPASREDTLIVEVAGFAPLHVPNVFKKKTRRFRLQRSTPMRLALRCGTQPCHGADVQVTVDVPGGAVGTSAEADENGMVNIDGLPKGTATATFVWQEENSNEARMRIIFPHGKRLRRPREVRLKSIAGTESLHGVVQDPDGHPRAHVAVNIDCGRDLRRSTKSEDDGRFVLRSLPSRTCTVSAHYKAPGDHTYGWTAAVSQRVTPAEQFLTLRMAP
jgi:hypothetical protein